MRIHSATILITLSFCIVFNLVWAQSESRLNPSKKLSQYVIRSWTVEDGLPAEGVTRLQQDKQGYIWATTFNGLARFDGHSFTTFNTANTPEFNTNTMQSMSRKGDSLFFALLRGIALYHNYIFQKMPALKALENENIESLCQQDDWLWIGTNSNGVYRFDGAELQHLKKLETITKSVINDIKPYKDNGLIIGTDDGKVILFQNEEFKELTSLKGAGSIRSLLFDGNNKLWLGVVNGAWLLNIETGEILEKLQLGNVNRLITDTQDNLWVASEKGLFRVNLQTHAVDSLTESNGLANNIVKDIIFDTDGHLWGATYRNGIFQLLDGPFTSFSEQEGLSSNTITSVVQMSPDIYWLADENGKINQLEKNTITQLDKPHIPQSRLKHLFADNQQRIWISSYGGLLLYNKGVEQLYSTSVGFPDNQVRMTFQDAQDQIWIGTKAAGIVKWNEKTMQHTIINQTKGLTSNYVMFITQSTNGEIVVGTKSGINVIRNDSVVRTLTTDNGLPSNFTFNGHFDKNNVLWLASNDGIIRVDKQDFFVFNTTNGLPENTIFDITEDTLGYFWLPSNKGVLRAKRTDMDKVALKKERIFRCQIFSTQHGLKKEQCMGAVQSYTDHKKQIWFMTNGGITMVDPYNLGTTKLQPKLYIESIKTDTLTLIADTLITIPSGNVRMQFNYTGIEFTAPENLQFKYRLVPFDNDWVDAHQQLSALYTNIAPGNYVFEVAVIDENNQMTTSTIRVKILAAWWQTWWFKVVGLLMLLVIVYLYSRYRTYQIEKQRDELEKIVKVRTQQVEQQKEELIVQSENLRQANEEIRAASETLSEQNKQLTTLYNNVKTLSTVGQSITSYLDIEMIIATAYEHVNSLIEASVFSIGIYNEDLNRIEFRGTKEKGEILPFHYFSLSETQSLSVICFTQQKNILINDIRHEYRQYMNELPEVKVGELPLSIIYLPIVQNDNVLGVISVQSFEANAYTDYHADILQNIATYTAIAIENAHSFHEIQVQKNIIEKHNEQIQGSLRYAQTIQKAILPLQEKTAPYFNSFAIYRPKDIVSGDFYWFSAHHTDDVLTDIFVAVVDCTGHGVPGAFMSMIGNQLLNRIVNDKATKTPAEILTLLDAEVQDALKQEATSNNDGMDVALCRIQAQGNNILVTYSGAKRNLYYYKQTDDEISTIEGSRRSIGGRRQRNNKVPFEQVAITMQANDWLYLSSDGMGDQPDQNRKALGSKKITDVLQANKHLSPIEQKAALELALDQHQKDTPQRDDISFWGIQLKNLHTQLDFVV